MFQKSKKLTKQLKIDVPKQPQQEYVNVAKLARQWVQLQLADKVDEAKTLFAKIEQELESARQFPSDKEEARKIINTYNRNKMKELPTKARRAFSDKRARLADPTYREQKELQTRLDAKRRNWQRQARYAALSRLGAGVLHTPYSLPEISAGAQNRALFEQLAGKLAELPTESAQGVLEGIREGLSAEQVEWKQRASSELRIPVAGTKKQALHTSCVDFGKSLVQRYGAGAGKVVLKQLKELQKQEEARKVFIAGVEQGTPEPALDKDEEHDKPMNLVELLVAQKEKNLAKFKK